VFASAVRPVGCEATAMMLYLVRHGPAANPDPVMYPDDAERPLTLEGRDRVTEMAGGLHALGVRVDRVVASPYRRAMQTAEILAEQLSPAPAVTALPALAPGGNYAEFMQRLDESGVDAVLAVGHMPDVAIFAARCLTGQREFGLLFKKGATCALTFEGDPAPGQARLDWLIQPGALRRLGR
jgi:phosphohistidine phosphatase